LLVARGRTVGAGWLLLAAMLVKVTMAYAIIPIAVWTATRHGRRAMFRFLAPTIVGMPLMALIPGALHSMTAANSGVVTRLAVWNVFIRVSWLEIPGLHPSNYLTAGLIAVVVIIAIAALIGRRQSDPGPGAAVGAAGWLVGAGYVLAWYTVFGFVVSALRPTSRLARWFALQGGVITAAYLIPRDRLTTSPRSCGRSWSIEPVPLPRRDHFERSREHDGRDRVGLISPHRYEWREPRRNVERGVVEPAHRDSTRPR